MKFEFSRQIFEKSLNIKFHKDSTSGSQSCSFRIDGRSDGQIWQTNIPFFAILRRLLKVS